VVSFPLRSLRLKRNNPFTQNLYETQISLYVMNKENIYYSSPNTVIGYGMKGVESGFDSQQSLLHSVQQVPMQASIQRIAGALFPGIKQQGRESTTDLEPVSNLKMRGPEPYISHMSS
jgi:hypothetical protein